MAKTHATTLQFYRDGPDEVAQGTTILSMPNDKFIGFRDAGLVREATDAEVARAQGKAPTKAAPKRAGRARKATGSAAPAKPARAPATPAPPPPLAPATAPASSTGDATS